MTFDSYAVYREHINSGKVRPLGVTSKSRMRALPQVPTIAETGLKGYEVSNWLGLFAPAGTPDPVIKTIHAALGRAMANRELREQLVALGIEPTFGAPEELAALIRAELPRWAEIVKKSGATVE
jgi:tripartite-type tricarboxylate transporter receptor subunit TctC